jgi:hypothetical protein
MVDLLGREKRLLLIAVDYGFKALVDSISSFGCSQPRGKNIPSSRSCGTAKLNGSEFRNLIQLTKVQT